MRSKSSHVERWVRGDSEPKPKFDLSLKVPHLLALGHIYKVCKLFLILCVYGANYILTVHITGIVSLFTEIVNLLICNSFLYDLFTYFCQRLQIWVMITKSLPTYCSKTSEPWLMEGGDYWMKLIQLCNWSGCIKIYFHFNHGLWAMQCDDLWAMQCDTDDLSFTLDINPKHSHA